MKTDALDICVVDSDKTKEFAREHLVFIPLGKKTQPGLFRVLMNFMRMQNTKSHERGPGKALCKCVDIASSF